MVCQRVCKKSTLWIFCESQKKKLTRSTWMMCGVPCQSQGENFLGASPSRTFFAELHRDDFRDAGLLHGDAVHDGSGAHGALAVGDEDELRVQAHLLHHFRKAADIGFVEGRVHFVENTEGTRLILEDADQ